MWIRARAASYLPSHLPRVRIKCNCLPTALISSSSLFSILPLVYLWSVCSILLPCIFFYLLSDLPPWILACLLKIRLCSLVSPCSQKLWSSPTLQRGCFSSPKADWRKERWRSFPKHHEIQESKYHTVTVGADKTSHPLSYAKVLNTPKLSMFFRVKHSTSPRKPFSLFISIVVAIHCQKFKLTLT